MPTNWIVLTVADIPVYAVDAIVQALRSSALGEGQDDPLPSTIEDISDYIRLQIATCVTNVLDATPHSIPKDQKRNAIALIIEAAYPRLLIDLTQDQRDAATNARTDLKRISDGKLSITKPDVAIPVPIAQTGASISIVKSQHHKTTGRGLDKL